MNTGHDTSGSTNHEADRRYLRWLKTASLQSLRARSALHARTLAEPWEVEALRRELMRRARVQA